MNPETKILLTEYEEEFKNYKNYIDSNNWYDDVFLNSRNNKLESTKLNTETSIIETIIKSTTKFKEDVGEDIDKKPIQSFINFISEIINRHIERVQKYKKMYPLTEGAVESEVEFHSDLFALITKTKIALSKLKIDENEISRKSIDLFYGNSKAPLMMRNFLSDTFQVIRDKTEKLGIDFSAAHINPATSNEMFINMKSKDIPPWDLKKHFFEQEISTIQFWEEERKKITNGININGQNIPPFMYWHLNHFKLSFGAGLDKRITQPYFRDNEYFFQKMYEKAEKHGRCGLLMYGSRRWTKSVIMSSHVLHKMLTMEKCQGTVQGYSAVPDLKAIIDYISDAVENLEPALRIPANSMDLTDGAILGLKGKKVQERFDYSRLSIVNLEGGNTKKGGQKTAGATPDVFVFEEIAKGNCITPWESAKPSFEGGKKGKWRCTPLLAATAGDSVLSQDAEILLKNPEDNDILPMDYDLLEEFIDPDYITWKRTNFGMFLPAQMSLGAPEKIIKPFGEFINNSTPDLNNINIHITDWKAAKLFFEEERNRKSKDMNVLAAYTNAFPLDPEDCYITTEVNIFPGLESKNRKRFVEDHGLGGEKYRLYKDANGTIHADISTDPIITDYPFKGGNFDAPIVMMENPLLQADKPPLGLYIIGFDDAKQDTSSGDSVMSATIFKRSFDGGEWANRIVGYYASRPDKKRDYYKNLYLIMKIFNARLLHENEDNGYVEFLEENHSDDLYIHISTGVGLASEENLNRNHNRKWGWSPTPNNIYHGNQKVVRYTKSDGNIIGEQEGLSGVDLINDTMLLEELYKYKNGNNADRIRSFSLALTLAQYYDRTYQYMKMRRKTISEEDMGKKKKVQKQSRGLMDSSRSSNW